MSSSRPTYPYVPVEEPKSPYDMGSKSVPEKQRLNAQRQIQGAKQALAESLLRIGDFDEALAICENLEYKAFIQTCKEACEKPDDERCKCEHYVDRNDYTRLPDGPPKLERMPHYIRHQMVWSPWHGKDIWVNICHKCNHAQAIDGEMDEIHTSFYKRGMDNLAKVKTTNRFLKHRGQP